METTYELYISADPESGKLDLELIRDLLTKRHDTFTVKGMAEGYWGGVDIETVIIMLTDIPDYVDETITELQAALGHPQIAKMEVNDLEFM